MQARPQERGARALIRQAITIAAFVIVSAVAVMIITNKIRSTWSVLNILEQRVDGMIASAPVAPELRGVLG